MIVVTGAAGFIGSCLASHLYREGNSEVIVVDNFTVLKKAANFKDRPLDTRVLRDQFFDWVRPFAAQIEGVFHLGARTDTAEKDTAVLEQLNVRYSKEMWRFCSEHSIPLVYASSAATYGAGEQGYSDDHALVEKLKPLNPYGDSKQEFDLWALQQRATPPFWAGLKFFNVYGPNEYHKGRMASVVYHAFNQIETTQKVKLFASHHPDYKDGEQKRDFIYVKDVLNSCTYLMENHRRLESGLYNLGTGVARTFNDLAQLTFQAMGKPNRIDYIPTPEDILPNYQYFTQAKMDKLTASGYPSKFHTLEEGIADYVKNYLIPGRHF